MKSPIFLTNFDQIWISSTDFHRCPQYQISQKSVHWQLRWCMQTEGRTDRPADGHDRVIDPLRDHADALNIP